MDLLSIRARRFVRMALCALAVVLHAVAQARQPVEHFARLPLITAVSLSPSGERWAGLVNQGNDTRLITRTLGEAQPRVALSTDNDEFQFNWVRWVNDERLLVSVRFVGRRGRVDTMETRLVSVRFDGSGQVNLVQRAAGERRIRQFQDQVIDWMPDDGRHVLLQLRERAAGPLAVYRVNVETGAREVVKSGESGVGLWGTDAAHRVRVAWRADDDNRIELRVCDPDGENWRTLWRFAPGTTDSVRPLGFDKDPQRLFIEADHEGRSAVFVVDLRDPGLERRLLLAHAEYDVRGQLLRARDGEVLGLRDDGQDERSHWWHPQWQDLARSLDQALAGRRNRLLQVSADERRYLVYSSGNGIPGQYYLGDRETGRLSLLAEQFPQLKGVSLAAKRPVRFTARDGLAMTGFLTLPAGAGERPRAPLVLLPHGGPAGMDRDAFDPWAAYLADRGVAVLQVNFRGSAGLGRDFVTAGLQRWGLEMQDDLADGVAWAVAEQIADPARICIVGGSYGGYAALMGVVKTPKLYRCAVSLNGVGDLSDLIEHESRRVGGHEVMERMLGHAWRDRERLRATSPALQAGRIEVPVLLVAGSADLVVPVEQSRAMAAALRNADKPHRYVEIPGADHRLSQQAHRNAFFTALDGFLDEHLAAVKP